MTEPVVEPATEMPEAEPETPTEQEANEVPDTELEPDGDQPETDEPEGEPEGDEEEEGISALSQGLTKKQRQLRDQKLDSEKTRHAKRIGEIMGDEAVELIPCPVCMDSNTDGWIFAPEAKQLAPEAISRIRTVIGLPDYTTFKQSTDAATCPDCDGLGETITGSHVPGYETKSCGRCGKTGWIPTGTFAVTQNGPAEPAPIVTGPTMFPVTDPDPEIQHLRERGFTVIPPMQIAGT